MKRPNNFFQRLPIAILHTLVIMIWTIFFSIIQSSIIILFSFFGRFYTFNHNVAKFWARTILWVTGITVKVEGLSHLRKEGSYIYMVNHQSNFDIPVLLSALPVEFRWLAKEELFRIPIFGRGMRACGYISINRSNRKEAFVSLKKAAETIRNGTSVLIFPEGTRSSDGSIRPFKKGGFVLAVDAGVPVIPIVVNGTWEIMPKRKFLIRRSPVKLTILDPVDTSQYTRKEKDRLKEKIEKSINDCFNETRKRL